MRLPLAAAVLLTVAAGCGGSSHSGQQSPQSSGAAPGCSAFCQEAGPEQGGHAYESCATPKYPCHMLSLLSSSATVTPDGTFHVRVRCGWQRNCNGAVVILKTVTDQTMSEAARACVEQPATEQRACEAKQFRLGGSDFAVAHTSSASVAVALNSAGLRALHGSGTLTPDIEAHIKGCRRPRRRSN